MEKLTKENKHLVKVGTKFYFDPKDVNSYGIVTNVSNYTNRYKVECIDISVELIDNGEYDGKLHMSAISNFYGYLMEA